jgi:hypothetical protein
MRLENAAGFNGKQLSVKGEQMLLFPAHAGMNRCRGAECPGFTAVPRTRGASDNPGAVQSSLLDLADLTHGFPVYRRCVAQVFPTNWRDKFTANEIIVFLFEQKTYGSLPLYCSNCICMILGHMKAEVNLTIRNFHVSFANEFEAVQP